MSASVEPRRTIRLASRATGTLEEVGPEVGDHVEQGDVLARIDRSEERARLDRAQAEEDNAELEYARARELRDRGSLSRAEYERARVELAVARSERLLYATRVDQGRVVAPRDGVITARHIEPGEGIESEDPVFDLVAMDHLVIRPGVSERDVRHLERGQRVPVRLDALPDELLEGRIARIFPAAAHDSRLVPVEIDLPPDAAELGVRPGYLARVRMPIDRRPDVLAVPAESIGEGDDDRYVMVIEQDELARRSVEPGVSRGGWTEIRSGLEAGEVVLATNPLDMSAGDRVRIVGWRG